MTRASLLLIVVALVMPVPALGQAEPATEGSVVSVGSEAASESFVLHGRQTTRREDGLALSGNVYIDTGYENSARGLAGEADRSFWLQQGRFMVQATHIINVDSFFIQVQGQVLAHVDEIAGEENIDTDDAWAKVGVWDLWDVQVGRYEAWEVFHKGQGLERDTLEDLGAFDGPDIYEVNYAFYRQDGFGQAAVHLYPLDIVRFELGTVFGNQLGFNSIGVRPAAIVDLGPIKIKVAGEWRQLEHQDEDKRRKKIFWEEKRGFGGSVQGFFGDPDGFLRMQIGINGAFGLIDKLDADGKVDERASTDTTSVGGFANLGLGDTVVGLGLNLTLQGDRNKDDVTGKVGHFEHVQAFGSIKHPVLAPEATVKLVAAYARADLEPAYDNPRLNEMMSLRVRLMILF